MNIAKTEFINNPSEIRIGVAVLFKYMEKFHALNRVLLFAEAEVDSARNYFGENKKITFMEFDEKISAVSKAVGNEKFDLAILAGNKKINGDKEFREYCESISDKCIIIY